MDSYKVQRQDWSLNIKGELDAARHDRLAQKCLRAGAYYRLVDRRVLGQVGVQSQELIEYRFHFTAPNTTSVSSDPGSKSTHSASTELGNAGASPGIQLRDVDVQTVLNEDLYSELYTGLRLPGISDDCSPSYSPYLVVDSVTPHRGSWNRRNSLLTAYKRQALHGEAAFQLKQEDMRYRKRYWPESPYVLVFAIMDTSGSMWATHKNLGRLFNLHLRRFLQSNYPDAEIIYIVHDSQARTVSATDFFQRHESGGTCCSTAFELAERILLDRLKQRHVNAYVFYTSDGHNLESDNSRALHFITRVTTLCQLVAYAETCLSSNESSHLFSAILTGKGLAHFKFAQLTPKGQMLSFLRGLLTDTAK